MESDIDDDSDSTKSAASSIDSFEEIEDHSDDDYYVLMLCTCDSCVPKNVKLENNL